MLQIFMLQTVIKCEEMPEIFGICLGQSEILNMKTPFEAHPFREVMTNLMAHMCFVYYWQQVL